MNKNVLKPGLFAVILSLCSACSGSGGGSGDNSTGADNDDLTATRASIVSFTVDGTSDPTLPTQPEPISPSENNGNFRVSWEIDTDGIVDVELSVTERDDSGAPFFCGREDTELFDRDCSPTTMTQCQQQVALDCQFRNDSRVRCTNAKTANLSEFLDEIPKQADLVLCVKYNGGSDRDSVPVQFR